MLIVLTVVLTHCTSNNEIKTIKIGMCSDVHLPTMHDSEQRLSQFIDSMKIADPDFIIELGDFVIPKEKYHHLYEIWKSFPGSKYHVIGNHEMDGGTTLEEAFAYRNPDNHYPDIIPWEKKSLITHQMHPKLVIDDVCASFCQRIRVIIILHGRIKMTQRYFMEICPSFF